MKKMMTTFAFFAVISVFSNGAAIAGDAQPGFFGAASVLVRQVLDRKLLKKSDAGFANDLKMAVMGSGNSPIQAQLSAMSCTDPGMSHHPCTISVKVVNPNDTVEPEFTFDLQVDIANGQILSATIANQAG